MDELEEYRKHLPMIINWVKDQENYIRKNGVALNEDQKIDAYLIGIKNIDKVRLLEVDKIPILLNEELAALSEKAGLQSDNTIGVTFGYGIYVKKGFSNRKSLIVHELVHTMQYERLGSIEVFLNQYLMECLTEGYPNGALELEARRVEKEMCR